MPDVRNPKSSQSPWSTTLPFAAAPAPPVRKSGHGPASWLAALSCLLHRNSIDRELAAGADPDASECRQRRASKLIAQSSREALAENYERLQIAATSASPLDAAPSNWRDIRAARPALDRLVKRLREDRNVRAAGVARARLLFNDRHSALHDRNGGAGLVDEVRTVLARL
jgi:hypothetical protein